MNNIVTLHNAGIYSLTGDGMRLSVLFFKKARRHRHFALFNEQGQCIAFKTCEQIPSSGNWQPVEEINLSWLSTPLASDTVNTRLSDNTFEAPDRS